MLLLRNTVESCPSKVPALEASEAVPVKLAVIVPAEKFPELSLITAVSPVALAVNDAFV